MYVISVKLYLLSRILEVFRVKAKLLIPVAARPKAWVEGRSLAGIAGSNPAADMDAILL